MPIIRRASFTTTPWKNGGGITHEVAKAEDTGGLLWRFSLAEVASDGPFSLFPGLARILTVIEGHGMNLLAPSGNVRYELPPMKPVHFSGDEALSGRLREGPCLDFNLIYNPRRFSSVARVIEAGRIAPGGAAVEGLLCLAGSLQSPAGTLQLHDFALIGEGDAAFTLSPGARALHFTLQAL